MQQTFSIYLLVALAFVAANLPFFNGRLFALFPWPLAQGCTGACLSCSCVTWWLAPPACYWSGA